MQWFCDFACLRNEPKFSRKLPFCFESVHEDSQKCRNTAFPPSGNNLRVLTRPILAQPDLHLCNRCCLHSHSCNLHTKSMLHTSYVKLLQSHIKLPSDDHRYRVFLVPSDAISSNQHIYGKLSVMRQNCNKLYKLTNVTESWSGPGWHYFPRAKECWDLIRAAQRI